LPALCYIFHSVGQSLPSEVKTNSMKLFSWPCFGDGQFSSPARKHPRSIALISGLALASLALHSPIAVAATPAEVLVIINDTSPTSLMVGQDYAQKRHVENILHIHCEDSALSQKNETITLKDYSEQIETPLRAYLQSHPSINFIVTTKGVPIRISGAASGWETSGSLNASLDSYLAALDYDQLPGAVKVEFKMPKETASGWAWQNRYWNANVPFTHAQFGGYLVTRLDGYTQADALSLTKRALAAEKHVKKGIILFDVDATHGEGDKTTQPGPLPSTVITAESSWDTWNADMIHAHDDLVTRKVPDQLDLTNQFIGNKKNLLGYFSWGSNDAHFSQAAYNSLHFLPGAIGDTAVSTGARSFFHQTEGQSMIADLIAQGITGVKGYADEPLLQAVASPTIALNRYLSGFTLAESFYAASHFVGWTDVVIGDPLACPYCMQNGKKAPPL
jgi:uncharacterized protein (TIGR03790 family)